MSLRYINSNGEEAFIAGRGGGGNADIIPLKQFEFDELYSKGELEDGKYYAITDDVDEATILTELAELKADIGNVDARISADGETLPLGTGTVYSAINSVNDKVGEIDNKMNYSSTPKKIGKWIDGSDLYNVVVSLNATSDTWEQIPHNIPGINQVVHVDIPINAKGQLMGIGLGTGETASPYEAVLNYINNTGVRVRVGSQRIGIWHFSFYYI